MTAFLALLGFLAFLAGLAAILTAAGLLRGSVSLGRPRRRNPQGGERL